MIQRVAAEAPDEQNRRIASGSFGLRNNGLVFGAVYVDLPVENVKIGREIAALLGDRGFVLARRVCSSFLQGNTIIPRKIVDALQYSLNL